MASAAVMASEPTSGSALVPVTIFLSAPSPSAISVTLTTSVPPGSLATSNVDFDLVSSPIVIPAGATSVVFNAVVHADAWYDGGETFAVTITSIAGSAVIGPVAATVVTIDDSGPPPTLQARAPAASPTSALVLTTAEGDRGNTTLIGFELVVSRPSEHATPIIITSRDVAFPATRDVDFRLLDAASGAGLSSIPPAAVSHNVTVAVIGDLDYETDELVAISFATLPLPAPPSLNVTLTIINDDTRPVLSWAAREVAVAEGSDPASLRGSVANLTLVLSAPSYEHVSVGVGVVLGRDGDPAVASVSDIFGLAISPLGTPLLTHAFSFYPGTTQVAVQLFVVGDVEVEDDEVVSIEIRPASITNALLDDDARWCAVTIVNDDEDSQLSVDGIQRRVGNWWWIFVLAMILLALCCCCCLFFLCCLREAVDDEVFIVDAKRSSTSESSSASSTSSALDSSTAPSSESGGTAMPAALPPLPIAPLPQLSTLPASFAEQIKLPTPAVMQGKQTVVSMPPLPDSVTALDPAPSTITAKLIAQAKTRNQLPPIPGLSAVDTPHDVSVVSTSAFEADAGAPSASSSVIGSVSFGSEADMRSAAALRAANLSLDSLLSGDADDADGSSSISISSPDSPASPGFSSASSAPSLAASSSSASARRSPGRRRSIGRRNSITQRSTRTGRSIDLGPKRSKASVAGRKALPPMPPAPAASQTTILDATHNATVVETESNSSGESSSLKDSASDDDLALPSCSDSDGPAPVKSGVDVTLESLSKLLDSPSSEILSRSPARSPMHREVLRARASRLAAGLSLPSPKGGTKPKPILPPMPSLPGSAQSSPVLALEATLASGNDGGEASDAGAPSLPDSPSRRRGGNRLAASGSTEVTQLGLGISGPRRGRPSLTMPPLAGAGGSSPILPSTDNRQ
ncbi:uncharacterized protein AMSG_09753 [Thecamonas trahens ATCC 50062]|uniref:Calx-beta domain-containing protein n=1 Tax=Thecamonas trahens ATCC 50062 TaxID=461836 RepID=A0A0L0DRP0_THETB|nr:hypothetical protein AMSG_09753 [Thecamonas trahens ATCC 50062]KNC54088.1 hypothetical protein AMSG_09753 [Thecamonas trahens ATCC 50062]|eukprot:XP_013754097.1 hypothetical protein AMSG_09753 [Thecamonas trahens ATCC 50062]